MKHVDRFSNDELHLIEHMTKNNAYTCYSQCYGRTGDVEQYMVAVVKDYGYVNVPMSGFEGVSIFKEGDTVEGNVELYKAACDHMYSGIEYAVMVEMGFINDSGAIVKDEVVKFLGDVNRASTMRRAIKLHGADKAYRQLSAMGFDTKGFFELVKMA